MVDSLRPCTTTGGAREARALLILAEVPGVGLRGVRRLVERFGTAEAVLDSAGRTSPGGLPRAAIESIRDGSTARRVDIGLEAAGDRGISWIAWNDPRYPARLHRLADPPPVLFLIGRADLLGTPGVAVIGARRATERARSVACRLGSRLAAAGFPVVSGLALGIDGMAHRGALETGGPTVAVVGTGPDRAYPRSHLHLQRDIAEHGLIVSEFLPGTPPLPHHFPRRNRVLAALAHTVVVVEAGGRSGSLITVDHALDLGLEVWAVPGPIDAPCCAGSNLMLADGARALATLDGFLQALAEGEHPRLPAPRALEAPLPHGDRPLQHPSHSSGAPVAAGRAESEASLRPIERSLLECVGTGIGMDDLARRTGLPSHELIALLSALEIRGWVERRPGPSFRLAG